MKFGTAEAESFLDRLYNQGKLKEHLDGKGLYGDRKGHLRFARETGPALFDFDEQGRRCIESESYERLYLKGTYKPALSAEEWLNALLQGAHDASVSWSGTRKELAALERKRAASLV